MARLKDGILGAGLSGKSANAVFVRTEHGTIMRERVVPHDPKTAAQLLIRAAQSRATKTWPTLDLATVARWRVYATANGLRPMNAFTTLYTRLLRFDMGTPPPLFPPDRPFFGDTIRVSATPTSTGVTFTASGPNAANVVTELLLQPLASMHRRVYQDKYKLQACVAFPAAGTTTVPCQKGWYAAAYRFVNRQTGQSTRLAELGIVQV